MTATNSGWWMRASMDEYPSEAGHYRIRISGDSESVDGFTIYDYPDYETWAWWEPATSEELEDFPGGHKGSWHTQHDEEDCMIFAWFGPVKVPEFSSP